jgi:hypothetical protein
MEQEGNNLGNSCLTVSESAMHSMAPEQQVVFSSSTQAHHLKVYLRTGSNVSLLLYLSYTHLRC